MIVSENDLCPVLLSPVRPFVLNCQMQWDLSSCLTLHLLHCLQVTFKGGVPEMHGTDNGKPATPDWIYISPSTLGIDEQLISMFGSASGSSVTTIGFTTKTGTILGPYGAIGSDGVPFAVYGLLLGFFGALKDGAISGTGAWYTPEVTSTFPRSGEMSPAYGNLVNVWSWDDTPDMGGAHHPFPVPDVASRMCGTSSSNMCRFLEHCLHHVRSIN
jgi:hypothetical protein